MSTYARRNLLLIYLVIFSLLIALSLQTPTRAFIAAGALDGHWVSGFGRAILRGGIWEMVVDHDGNLYAGGSFDDFGAIMAHHIVRWDGAAWHPVGEGLNDRVSALAVGPDNRIYAGGSFTKSGDVAVNHIAAWDGSRWQALGPGLNGDVEDIAIAPDGDLYAVGDFTKAGTLTVNYVARWDGHEWHALGYGLPRRFGEAVAVAPDGTVYAAMFFTYGSVRSDVRKWDGQQWTTLPGSSASRPIWALACDGAGNLYAGGSFTALGGATMPHIAMWDGQQWRAPGGGVDGRVEELAFDARGRLVAAGEFEHAGGVAAQYVARWDGAAWQAVGAGLPPMSGEHVGVYALALDGEDGVYIGRLEIPYRLKEGQWRFIPPPEGNGLDAPVLALVGDRHGGLYAGGEFTRSGPTKISHVAHFDGSRWQALGEGLNNDVTALALAPDGALYVGGAFTATASGGVSLAHIARWDGAQWQPLGTGMDDKVDALATDSQGNLYAGGHFEHAGGVAASKIAKWDGQQWSPLGEGLPGPIYALLIAPNGDVYAGGWFDEWVTVNGQQERLSGIARWDGQHWRGLDDGLTNDHSVISLAMDAQGHLYAGGWFKCVVHGNVAANHIAMWDGQQWHPLGAGMDISDAYRWAIAVHDLTVDSQGNLFAAGFFDRAGGQPANYVALWDGANWHPLGEGLSGLPASSRADHVRGEALALVDNDRLFVGGYFDHAGGIPSVNIALWSWQTAPHALYLPLIQDRP